MDDSMKTSIKIVLKFLVKLFIVLAVVFAIYFFINKKTEKSNIDSTKETIQITKETETEKKEKTKIETKTNKKQELKQNENIEETYEYVEYKFRTKKLLNDHYKKHGKEMGFKNANAYEKAANKVINNKNALIKEEKEDGDYVYYVVDTNEIVFLSRDGYIRSYFNPTQGKKYFDKQ